MILKLNKGYNVEVETIQLEFVQNYHYNIYYSFMYFFTCRPNLNLRNMLACRRCYIYIYFFLEKYMALNIIIRQEFKNEGIDCIKE